MKLPRVSIVILNYYGIKDTVECISSILSSQAGIRYEVIVIDNGSQPDEAMQLINKFGSKIKLFRQTRNLGFTGGNNWAISKCHGDYLFLLNNDTTLTPNCLKRLVSYMDKNTQVAVVQPKIKYYFNTKLFDYAGASGGFIDIFGYPFTRGRVFEHIEKDLQQYNTTIDIFWASGAALMVRKSHLNQVGGLFNPLYFNYMEEIDFCWRVWNHGLVIKSLPSAEVNHKVAQSSGKNHFKKRFWEHRNNLILLALNLSLMDIFSLIPGRILLEILTYFHYLFSSKFTYLLSLACAHLHFIYLLPYLLTLRRGHKLRLSLLPVYGHSVCVDYFVLGRKTFSRLRW